MATWIVHMRVAEELNKILKLKEEEFLVGNIGPDSGVCNEDGTKFDPPKNITHWVTKEHSKGIQAEEFFKEYIKDCSIDRDCNRDVFLLGYYIHLLTDIAWTEMHNQIKRDNPEYNERIKNEPGFIWNVVKKDWYGLDFKYLRDNQDNIFNRVFLKIQAVPDYLEYFPKNAFTKSVQNITEFYTTEEANCNKEFVYLKEEQVKEFVKSTVNSILNRLQNKSN